MQCRSVPTRLRTALRRRSERVIRAGGALLVATAALTLGIGVLTQSAAFADSETIGDTWSLASTGWMPIWWCQYSDATGEGCFWYYSYVDAGGGLKWEQWRDNSGNYYVKMVQDTWYGNIGGQPGYGNYPNEAGVFASAVVSTHWEGSTQISSAYENPSLGCPWNAEPPYTPCGLSTYNNQGYHFYAPWYDKPSVFYESADGYLPVVPSGSEFEEEVLTPQF